jgi:poly-beta-1,6-N-acetyl-D-glucosamine biosynthesis protein PgaD
MSKLVINNPGGAHWMQRLTQRGLTFIFWVVFGLLFRPILTLLAWLLGGHFFTEAMVDNHGYLLLLDKIWFYLLVILAISALLIGWASYNLLRFRNKERRNRQPDPVCAAAQAAVFGLDRLQVSQLQQQRRMVLQIDEQGRPVLTPY